MSWRMSNFTEFASCFILTWGRLTSKNRQSVRMHRYEFVDPLDESLDLRALAPIGGA